MEINILMWGIVMIPATIMLCLLATSKLSIYRNYLFLIIFLQAFLYLNFCPTLVINSAGSEDMKWMYVWIQLFCVVFFEIPLILIYLISKSRTRSCTSEYLPVTNVNNSRQLIFSIVMLLIDILFVYVILRYGLIFTRIGSEAKANIFVKLSLSPLWLISRLIEKSIIFMVGILLLAWLANNKSIINRTITFISLLVTVVIFGVYYLINSRLTFALFLVFIFGIIIYQSEWRFLKKRMFIFLLIFLPFAMIYSIRVTSNIRSNFFKDNGVSMKNFIPWYSAENQSDNTPFIKRMDGIDLMARVSLNMSYYDIPLGKAWSNPLFMIFGIFVNKEKANDLKRNTITTAKSYLMENFTDIKLPDYYSCMLTDAYGNFWILGLVFVAAFLAKLSAYIDKNLFRPRSTISLILSVYLISIVLPFEQEFISIITNVVQTLPVLFLVIILNPLKIKVPYKDGGNYNVFG